MDTEQFEWQISIDKLQEAKEKIVYFDRKDGSQGASIRVETARLRQPDRFGNTHTMWVRQTKEERSFGDKAIYIGTGKRRTFESANRKPENEEQPF